METIAYLASFQECFFLILLLEKADSLLCTRKTSPLKDPSKSNPLKHKQFQKGKPSHLSHPVLSLLHLYKWSFNSEVGVGAPAITNNTHSQLWVSLSSHQPGSCPSHNQRAQWARGWAPANPWEQAALNCVREWLALGKFNGGTSLKHSSTSVQMTTPPIFQNE